MMLNGCIGVLLTEGLAWLVTLVHPAGQGIGGWQDALGQVLRLPVVLQEETGSEGGVVVIVMTAGGGAAFEREVTMGFEVFKSHLVTVGTVVPRNRHRHGVGDLLVVLPVAGYAVHGINVLEKDCILGIAEFADGVRIAGLLQFLAVTGDAGFVGDAGAGKNILLFLVRVAGVAFHLDLVMPIRSDAWQQDCLVFGLEENPGEPPSKSAGDGKPEDKMLVSDDPRGH